jgi:hypothetical protein
VIGEYGKDSWIFDISNRQWKKLKNDLYHFLLLYKVTGRWNHSLSVWKVNDDSVWLIVFGGRNCWEIFSDTAIIDISKSSDIQQ